MKKFLSLIFLLVSFTTAYAQSGLFDRVDDINDFRSRVTKVVVFNDNSMIDLFLKDAVLKNWEISPYEFCDQEEFAKIKTDTSYYFLIRVKGENKKDRSYGMDFITLLKGGPDAVKGINHMSEIVTLPLLPTGSSSDRIFSYLPSYVYIIQSHVNKILTKKVNGFIGMLSYGSEMDNIDNLDDMQILFLKSDISYDISEKELGSMFNGHAKYVTADEISKALSEKRSNVLVSLTISPEKKMKKSYCYKMLIRATDGKLFFYRTHKINRRKGKGFLKEDMRRLSTPFSL
ncbi:MAG: hypothetical protein WC140_07660 [Bacteroidales bacterium]